MEEFQRGCVRKMQPLADGSANKDVQLLQESLPGVGEGQHVVETRMEVVHKNPHNPERFEGCCRNVAEPVL